MLGNVCVCIQYLYYVAYICAVDMICRSIKGS